MSALVEAARAALECFDNPADHFPYREWDRRLSALRAALTAAEQPTGEIVIRGLHSVTNEDDGVLTLRFADDASAERFMDQHRGDAEDAPSLHRAAAEAQPTPSVQPVAFDHDIGADRFNVVKGPYWWRIRIGGGTANVGKFHTKLAAEDMALKLLTAFRDGAYMQFHTAPPAQPAPAGWKLVPVEPTPEMVAAYLDANSTYWREMDIGPEPIGKWRNGTPADATAESYRAMLAASPAAPAQPADSERRPYGDLRNAKWLDPECYGAGECQSLLFKAAAPAQVPLTDERIAKLGIEAGLGTDIAEYPHGVLWFDADPTDFARAIERAHGIKGTT